MWRAEDWRRASPGSRTDRRNRNHTSLQKSTGIRIKGASVKHVGKDDKNVGGRGRRMTVSSMLAWATVKDLALAKQSKQNRIKVGEESCRTSWHLVCHGVS